MRIQVVYQNNQPTPNFEQFLLHGKIGDTSLYAGHYESLHDISVEHRDFVSSIAASIFLRKDKIVLFHWHVINGKRVEDEYLFAKGIDEFLEPTVLFKRLISSAIGPNLRRTFKATSKA